jgi:hypothetical protein
MNILHHASFILTMAVILCGCPKPEPTPPPPPGGATCESVCAHWGELGCEEAQPTPDGDSCVAVCENIQRGNLPDDLECQASVTDCEQINDC